MEKALIHKSDGTTSVVEFDSESSSRFLSDAVGGLFELVHLAPNLDLWVNENFIAEIEEKNLKMNVVASAMFTATTGATYPIFGDVVFTGGVDDEGETLGLADETITKLEMIIQKSAPLIAKINERNAE